MEQTSWKLLLMGPEGEIVKKYAACGWAVVQMDLDGGMTPWYGLGGMMPISLEVGLVNVLV